jgi:hypothetical protein
VFANHESLKGDNPIHTPIPTETSILIIMKTNNFILELLVLKYQKPTYIVLEIVFKKQIKIVFNQPLRINL